MAEEYSNGSSFEFNEDNIIRIKRLYSETFKYDTNNPMKICMKLVWSSANEKDPQKRQDLSLEFSKFLISPGGVMRLFLTVVDFDTSSQKITTLNQRFIAITNMILGMPKLCMPFDGYCCNIAKQIKSLLYSDNREHSSLGSMIIKSMIESCRGSGEILAENILEPIFNPISKPGSEYMTTTQSIKSIHSMITNNIPVRHFVPLFYDLTFILIVLEETPLQGDLKRMIRTTLCQILNNLKSGPACCLLQGLLLHVKRKSYKYQISRDEDEIEVVSEIIDYVETIDFELIEKTLLSLLKQCKNETLILEFFFHFLEEMWKSRDEYFSKNCLALVLTILEETISENTDSELSLFAIIVNDLVRTLELIVRTLTGYLTYFQSQKDDREELITKSIKYCLDIVQLVSLSPINDNEDEFEHLKCTCLTVLQQIKDAILSRRSDQERDSEIVKVVVNQLTTIIQHLSRIINDTAPYGRGAMSLSERKYREHLKDLNDRLVPIRVHALVELKRAITMNDPFTMSHIADIQSIVESSLADPETYVFLECINLVVELSLRRTHEILPRLVELYSNQSLDLQHRINVGEVLVRLTKQLNDTTPHYCDQVMNTLFNGLRDYEELIRTSSLVNIGEICHNLGYSLGNYLVEILTYIETIIDDVNETLQVKCAAIDLLRTTLTGLSACKVESIQQESPRIYRILKKLRVLAAKVLDDRLTIQTDLLSQEVDRIARELLGLDAASGKSKPRLEKHINGLRIN